MKNIKFVKVLKLTQRNLDRERKVINVTLENETKMSQYNFLIKALDTYRGKEFDDNELITEFIKCNLPVNDEDKARTQWMEGIEHEGHIYKAWFATTGGMKQEDDGISDTLFIREDYIEFAQLIENLISLGKFTELEEAEEKICINKDVLSRLSLITSDLITEIEMPNFIVLPQAKFHLIKNYKTVEPTVTEHEDEDGKKSKKVDYKLIDISFDDEMEVFDGGGIGTPRVFESIGKTLNRNDIEFAIIRGYGLGIKGLITKFDIIGYLDCMHKEDTDYCKKENDKYYLLDRWNEWQEVTDNTILLNESMVKLAKFYKTEDDENLTTYYEKMDKLNKKEYRKYGDLVNKLYITKVNKRDEEISDYRRSNYQLINSLALTINDYKKLVYQDQKLFSKIISPLDFDSKDEKTGKATFKENIDYILLFYKQFTNNNIQESDENYEEKINEALENVVDKTHELININPKFVDLNYTKQNLRRFVEKKVRELACGKVTLKAKYQYMAIDPISYMNFAMNRNQGKNGLDEGQFYSGDCQNGDIRTIQRNPLSAYSEVHNVEFIRNDFFDKWLCKSKEIIYFNQKSDIQNLLSSADFDGDAVTVIDSDVIRNAVVTPKDGKYFMTKLDGKKQELKYNWENRFISTYRASGNLIGSIALKAASINSDSQHIPDYWNTVNNKFISYWDIREELETENEDITKEEIKKIIKDKRESGELIYSYKADEDTLREYIKNRFYENEKEIYICLYNSMCAIDTPKTLTKLGKEYMEILDKKYYKQTNFLQYRKNRENVYDGVYFRSSNSLLDRYSKYIQKELLDTIEGNIKATPRFSSRHQLLQKCFNNEEYTQELYDLVNPKIEKLYRDYNLERQKAQNECRKVNKKLWEEKDFYEELQQWNRWDEENHYKKLAENKKKKYAKYKEIDKKYLPTAHHIVSNFDMATVCKCIADLKNCTENFILSLFFKCFEYVAKKEDNIRYVYEEDSEGDIEYLYEKYKRIAVKSFDNSRIIENISQEDRFKNGLEAKLRFRMTDDSVIEEIKKGLELGKCELSLNDERIELFEEFADIVKDIESVNVIKFDFNKNGKLAIAKKSFGVVIKL